MTIATVIRKLSVAATGAMLIAIGIVDLAQAAPSYIRSDLTYAPWESNTNETAMDMVFGAGNWDDLRYETLNVASLLSANTNLIYMEGSDENADELEAFLTANIGAIENWVSNGGKLFLNAGPNEGDGMSFGFGVNLTYAEYGQSVFAVNPAHPIFNGPFTPVTTAYTGTSFSHATVQGPTGFSSIINNEFGNSVLGELGFGKGYVLFGGMTTTNFHDPNPDALNLRANAIAYLEAQVTPEPTSILTLLAVGVLSANSISKRK